MYTKLAKNIRDFPEILRYFLSEKKSNFSLSKTTHVTKREVTTELSAAKPWRFSAYFYMTLKFFIQNSALQNKHVIFTKHENLPQQNKSFLTNSFRLLTVPRTFILLSSLLNCQVENFLREVFLYYCKRNYLSSNIWETVYFGMAALFNDSI